MPNKELLTGQVKLSKSGKGIFEVSQDEKYFLPKRVIFLIQLILPIILIF